MDNFFKKLECLCYIYIANINNNNNNNNQNGTRTRRRKATPSKVPRGGLAGGHSGDELVTVIVSVFG